MTPAQLGCRLSPGGGRCYYIASLHPRPSVCGEEPHPMEVTVFAEHRGSKAITLKNNTQTHSVSAVPIWWMALGESVVNGALWDTRRSPRWNLALSYQYGTSAWWTGFHPPLKGTEWRILQLIRNLRTAPSLETQVKMLRGSFSHGAFCARRPRKRQPRKIHVHLKQAGLPLDRWNTWPLTVKFLRILCYQRRLAS